MKIQGILPALLLGLGLVLNLPSSARAQEPCQAEVTHVQTFSAGAGALRNTSTEGAETDGSLKMKTITATVGLFCSRAERRGVRVTLSTANNVGGSAPSVPELLTCKDMRGGESAHVKLPPVSYGCFQGQNCACATGEGPVPKDQGGVEQVNVDAFTFTVFAQTVSDCLTGGDTGEPPHQNSADATLICKPSRTTLTQ